MNAAGAAVKRVMDEEITFQAELTVARWTGEYLHTQKVHKLPQNTLQCFFFRGKKTFPVLPTDPLYSWMA